VNSAGFVSKNRITSSFTWRFLSTVFTGFSVQARKSTYVRVQASYQVHEQQSPYAVTGITTDIMPVLWQADGLDAG